MLTWPHGGTDWKPYLRQITNTYLQLADIITRYEDLLGNRLQALGFERSWHGRTFAPPLSVSDITLEEADPDPDEDFSDLPGCWW